MRMTFLGVIARRERRVRFEAITTSFGGKRSASAKIPCPTRRSTGRQFRCAPLPPVSLVVCARHAPTPGGESPLRTLTGWNRNPLATASSRGGVGRKLRGESSARGTRITSGLSTWASWHGTTKPDFLSGRCLGKCGEREEKVMVLTRGGLPLCPKGLSGR